MAGNEDVANWPGYQNAIGSFYRGGAWNVNLEYGRVSDRYQAAINGLSREYFSGGRGVRTAE